MSTLVFHNTHELHQLKKSIAQPQGKSIHEYELYTEYGKLKKKLREYNTVKQNIDSILHPARVREQEKAL